MSRLKKSKRMRKIKKHNLGRKRKAALRRKGSTPPFAIHQEKKEAKAK